MTFVAVSIHHYRSLRNHDDFTCEKRGLNEKVSELALNV